MIRFLKNGSASRKRNKFDRTEGAGVAPLLFACHIVDWGRFPRVEILKFLEEAAYDVWLH